MKEKPTVAQPKAVKRNSYPIILIVITAIFAVAILSPLLFSRYLQKPAGLMDKARQQITEEDLEGAEQSLKKAIAKTPDDYTARQLLAQVYYLQKNYQGAYDQYNQAYQIDSNRHELLNLMANCQRDLTNYQEAEKLYRQAITKNPQSSIPYQNLAVMLRNLDKKKEAISVLKEGIKANPGTTTLKKLLKSID